MLYQSVTDQPFLVPVVNRCTEFPDGLFGMFYDGRVWQRTSNKTFLDRTLQFVSLFRQEGIEHGDLILIILTHGIDAHAAFFAAMLIGAVPSFLPYPNSKQDPELYWSQHKKIFAFCQPCAILVYDELRDAVLECVQGAEARVITQSAVEVQAPSGIDHLPRAEDVALLQHSSGTTGLKKGVALTYSSICMQLEAYSSALSLKDVADARIATWLPLYHDMGLISSFLLPLWLGLPIISLDPFVWLTRTWLFFEGIQEFRATHAWMPNFAFMHLVRTIRGGRTWDLSSVVALISCSEPCKVETFDAFLTKFTPWGITPQKLQTCYAMAETVFAVSQSTMGRQVRQLNVDRSCIANLSAVVAPLGADDGQQVLSNGKPVEGCRVEILRDGVFLQEREIGEVCVVAPFLFEEYYKNPIATAAAIQDGWYRTGDLGFLDDGEVFIVGRLKDVIIVNGKNLFAHDLEAAVSRVPGVKPGRAVAFGRYVASLGSEQLIIVAESDLSQVGSDVVIRNVNEAVLAEVGIACADIRVVEPGWLVKTTSGKTSRSENALKYATQYARADR
jgi:fatty-acyl-CoA synthase